MSNSSSTQPDYTATIAGHRNIRWIYRKLAQAGLGLGLMVMVIGMWQSTTSRGIETFEQHAYMLVREVVKQAKLPITQTADLNEVALKPITDFLTASEFIVDATIYADNGRLITQSANSLTLNQAIGIEKTAQAMTLFPIVEPVYLNGKLIAYLRVTFDYDAVQKDSKQFQDDFSGITRLMLFLCALIGILFARAFAREGK